LQTVARGFRHAHVVALPQGYGLLPVTEELLDEMAAGEPEARHEWLGDLTYLSSRLGTVACRLSTHVPVAYVETDYSGGVGTQGAILWQDGEASLGPIVSPFHRVDREAPGYPLFAPAVDWFLRRLARWLGGVPPLAVQSLPINCVLRRLGALDEFDALGLGRLRHTEDWVEEAHRTRGGGGHGCTG
jgi:hypothetical protein